MLTKQEHLLVKLNEECVEISKEVSKGLLFGISDRFPVVTISPSVKEKLIGELNDLMGVVHMLVEEGVLPENWQDRDKQLAKRVKVLKYMKYARERGRLEPEPNF
jgi:hypothetical protein